MKEKIDLRFIYERMGRSETTCDQCSQPIAESERRFLSGDEIVCLDCCNKTIHEINHQITCYIDLERILSETVKNRAKEYISALDRGQKNCPSLRSILEDLRGLHVKIYENLEILWKIERSYKIAGEYKEEKDRSPWDEWSRRSKGED